MSQKFLNFMTAFVLGIATSSMTSVAIAQTTSSPSNYAEADLIPLKSHTNVMGEAFFHDSNWYYTNIMIDRQFDFFFGNESFPSGNYPENETAWDAELINSIYTDMMQQQNESDPIIRVPDLPNPFNTSLRGNQVRSYRRAGVPYTPMSAGTEFVYERLP
jgi:hypothetical protein